MKICMSRGTWLLLGIMCVGGMVAVAAGVYAPADLRDAIFGILPVAVAILLHEAGHMLAARLCGVRLGHLRLDLFGARLGLRGMLSYRREWLIAAAGPAVNLLSAGILLAPYLCMGGEATAAYLSRGDGCSAFVAASLGLATVNLLPVRSLDGGRMLRCILAFPFGERPADAVLTLGTALCLGILWCLSVYALMRVGEMLSLFAFSLCLLLRMSGGQD